MDMHRQKLRPAYMLKRMKNAARGHGHAGKSPNNPHGRPPKLTGLEDRPYFTLRPRATIVAGENSEVGKVTDHPTRNDLMCRYEFNRFMRQVIQRSFNNAVFAAGGEINISGRLDDREFSRIYGPLYTIPTKLGPVWCQIIIEKRRLLVRLRFDLTDMPKTKTKTNRNVGPNHSFGHRTATELERYVADPSVTKYPPYWPVDRFGDWDGDISRMVEPEAVWSMSETGSAAFLYTQFVLALKWLVPARSTQIDALPKLPWRF